MNTLCIIVILAWVIIVIIDRQIQRRAVRKWCIEHDTVPDDTEVDERVSIIKRIFCKHEYVFERNIYGDEINHVGGNRSWWRCEKCGKRKLDPHLYPELERDSESKMEADRQ